MIESYIKNTVYSFFAEKKEVQFREPLSKIEEEIDNQLNQSPNNISALLIKAQILYKYHLKSNEALIIIQKVLQLDSSNIDGRIDIIQIYLLNKEKNAQKLQCLLDECFQIEQGYWRNYYIQCVLYFYLEKVDLGLETILQAKSLIPYNHWLESLVAQIYSDRKKGKNLEESKEIVDYILKEYPKDYELMIRLAYTYINLNQTDLTDQILQKALQLNPNSAKGCNNYGYLLRVDKKYEKSIKLCQKAVEIDQQYVDAFYNMASSYYNLKEYENSAKYFKKCIQLDRKRLGAYQELSYLYMEIIKDEDEANYYLGKFPKIFPQDEYGNNLYFLHNFRLLCENKPIDLEQAEISQFSNINRIKKHGAFYQFITYESSQLTLNYLYNV